MFQVKLQFSRMLRVKLLTVLLSLFTCGINICRYLEVVFPQAALPGYENLGGGERS